MCPYSRSTNRGYADAELVKFSIHFSCLHSIFSSQKLKQHIKIKFSFLLLPLYYIEIESGEERASFTVTIFGTRSCKTQQRHQSSIYPFFVSMCLLFLMTFSISLITYFELAGSGLDSISGSLFNFC